MQPTPIFPSYRYSRPEEWREFLEDKRDKVCSHRNIQNLGEFTPLLTNGLIVEARQLHSGKTILVQLDSVIWPDEGKRPTKPREAKPTKHKKQTAFARFCLDDLL